MQNARAMIRIFAAELGLTPLARTRIQIAEKPKNDGKKSKTEEKKKAEKSTTADL